MLAEPPASDVDPLRALLRRHLAPLQQRAMFVGVVANGDAPSSTHFENVLLRYADDLEDMVSAPAARKHGEKHDLNEDFFLFQWQEFTRMRVPDATAAEAELLDDIGTDLFNMVFRPEPIEVETFKSYGRRAKKRVRQARKRSPTTR